jgi:hypothetical protein
MNCTNESNYEGLVNLAEPKGDARLFAFDRCPAATDLDLGEIRGRAAWDVTEEEIEDINVLSGQKEHDVLPFVSLSGFDGLIARRKECPMHATEEELDELAVLSGVRERVAEEQFLDELENKLNYLMSEMHSTVRILKGLMKERRLTPNSL